MRKLYTLPVVALVTAAIVFTQTAAAQELNPYTSIDEFVRTKMRRLNIPGAALAIVRGEQIVHIAGYGVANDAGNAVTPDTPFLLASLSKSITALAVMQLVEQGKIELDAPIQQYLPWFLSDTPITVRQLLNQTSGLGELQGYERNLEPDAADALEQSIRRLAAGALKHQPGTTYEYSNSNYDVLGLLVEQVSGQSYGEYLQANIFEPLAATNIYTRLSDARSRGMSSAFYPFFGKQVNFDQFMPYSRATQPSAGVIGSAKDMAHYMIAHLNEGRFENKQILSPAGIRILHTSAVTTSSNAQYAMGWAIWEFTDAKLPAAGVPPKAVSHGGEWFGFLNLMLLIPEYDFGLVLLMNGRDPSTSSAFSNIAFDVALLALGLDAKDYPPHEDAFTANMRLIIAGIILVLLAFAAVAIVRLRSSRLARSDIILFSAMAVFDAALVIYTLFVGIPGFTSTLPLVLRFEPDMGLMLIVILVICIGWGSVRTVLMVKRLRSAVSSPAAS